MLEKFTEAAFGYCFAILEGFGGFFERTHAVVGLGVPLLIMAGVHLLLPPWVEAGIWTFVLGPAAVAAVTMVAHGFLLTRRH
ncbi:hypothetical protein [Massilia sp. Root335]|jgi:hypothetical protein|uniref:hypothetical protein n=1 Tax=Massilia sp. Root335 TaxID=1736517 RepID=UPI0006F7CF3B|nr:hypothetical protein [Massilia sp. Root335]KQV30584.1 hypothetical protein ASC93_03835 [Massilia sp. Root335]